jgi:hypothetical protein
MIDTGYVRHCNNTSREEKTSDDKVSCKPPACQRKNTAPFSHIVAFYGRYRQQYTIQ